LLHVKWIGVPFRVYEEASQHVGKFNTVLKVLLSFKLNGLRADIGDCLDISFQPLEMLLGTSCCGLRTFMTVRNCSKKSINIVIEIEVHWLRKKSQLAISEYVREDKLELGYLEHEWMLAYG
jgi:hypothetical protein